MIEVKGRSITLCQHGYLQDPEDWDVDVAMALAEKNEFPMADDHYD